MRIAKDATELVGRTPMVWLNRITKGIGAKIAVKLEYFNPMSSIKDRIGVGMIEAAERKGLLNPESVVVEPTSGNTGIALSFVCAAKGYRAVIFMPENFSMERQKIMKALGASIILTSASRGMAGAIEEARKYCETNRNTYMPQQFRNPANPAVHRDTTGPEIWRDTHGEIDFLVAGVGTGGTITGAGEYLKSKNPEIKIIAVEPSDSPVLSGGIKGPHRIQGIGAGFIPDVLNTNIYDEIIPVAYEDALNMAERLAREEGLFAGLSGASAAYAALQAASEDHNLGKFFVVIIPDSGERYLSEC